MKVWLAEKPDVGSKIAEFLGVKKKQRGSIDTADGTVTWAIGHLLTMLEPDDYGGQWAERWQMKALPMVPTQWKMKTLDSTAAQTAVVVELLKKATVVMLATDADREGELIGRELLAHAGYTGPIRRLWCSAWDKSSIAAAISTAKDGADTIKLGFAGLGRARADWLMGMNLTRAATLALRSQVGSEGAVSVGRVQTPTLAMVVRRDAEIEGHAQAVYFEVLAKVKIGVAEIVLRHARPVDSRLTDQKVAADLARSCSGQTKLTVTAERQRRGPPPLYMLLTLQKDAERLGLDPSQALEVAQSLYEKREALTYPRTEAAILPPEHQADAPTIFANLAVWPGIAMPIAPLFRAATWKPLDGVAHHAIVPTRKAITTAEAATWTEHERALYSMVAKRYVAQCMPDAETDVTVVSCEIADAVFRVSGRVDVVQGWRTVTSDAEEEQQESATLPAIENGSIGEITNAAVESKKTKPPKRYTSGTLLGDMATVAKFATDPVIKAKLKATAGLGTAATRAAIIDVLLERKFLAKDGKFLVSTEPGRRLIRALPERVTNPALTALWEQALDDVEAGATDLGTFARGIVAEVDTLVALIAQQGGISRYAGPPISPPTPAMLAHAQKLAVEVGQAVPVLVSSDGDACKAFIDRLVSSRVPTQGMLTMAAKLAEGATLSNEVRTQFAACKAFIDTFQNKPVKAK